MWTQRILAASALPALLLFSACSDNDSSPSAPEPEAASVRVAHLSPDAPAVDVWVDGSRVLEGVPFRAFSDYLSLDAGEHQIQVTPTGATEPVVIDATVDFAGGTSYTVAATGLLDAIGPSVFVDDRVPAAEGQAHVRFVHASPDAPPVNVAVANGGPTLFSGTAFGDATGYAAVAAGSYDLEVLLASNDALALSVPGVMLMDETNYTIFAVGLAGDGSLAAQAEVDTP